MWTVKKQHLGETIAEALARTLQQYIVELRPGFEPGQRVNVEELTTAFGVSATPVKEALKKLEANGLVEIRPRRGVFVSRLSAKDVEEISAVRSALEQVALRLCAEPLGPDLLAALEASVRACQESAATGDFERYRREDLKFHRLFVEASRNRRLVLLYQSLLDQLRIVMVYTPRTAHTIETSLQEHRHLLEVAQSGDLAALESELAVHWERSKERVYMGYRSYLHDRAGMGSSSPDQTSAVPAFDAPATSLNLAEDELEQPSDGAPSR